MKLSLTSVLLFITSLCFAQRQNVYFLKNNGIYVSTRDSADFIRVISEPDSGSAQYNVKEYYANGAKKLIGKSVTIDPQKFDGLKLSFFKNGQKESVTNYKNGSKAGDEFDYFPNGKIYLQKFYPDNGKPDNKFRDDFNIVALNDSIGRRLLTNGTGHYQAYDDDFTYVNEEGEMKNGKMTGTWKGDFKNEHITFTEIYDNDVLISGTAITEDGKNTSYTKSRLTIPEFNGGIPAFSRYLGDNIVYPIYARKNNIEGRVIVSFIVEKDGLVSNIKVARSVNKELDEEAVRVIKESPRWTPGTRFGLPVRIEYAVPIAFTLKN
ncbi:energy transducer TonB [Mucilaginibacter flavus]|uniref:energy transducer TonB n=1 Tax=Mucilaginibacter flavus TaxID=931504 RepID=UPI0025B3F04D|nr:energy transducer TonB [Mucilaginibacter flavus]MDN3584020.1 TonB family protein [Mucilaginibacter flavus]